MNLTEFLRARYDEVEALAAAAVEPDRPGIHWQWVTVETDAPVPAGDIAETLSHQAISLKTVEQFPTPNGVGDPPGVILWYVDDGAPGAFAHIARHDPARVLRDVAAKRAIVAAAREYASELEHGDSGEWAFDLVLRHLAAAFDDHPDYDEAWRP